MKTINNILCIVAALSLTACGNHPEEVSVKLNSKIPDDAAVTVSGAVFDTELLDLIKKKTVVLPSTINDLIADYARGETSGFDFIVSDEKNDKIVELANKMREQMGNADKLASDKKIAEIALLQGRIDSQKTMLIGFETTIAEYDAVVEPSKVEHNKIALEVEKVRGELKAKLESAKKIVDNYINDNEIPVSNYSTYGWVTSADSPFKLERPRKNKDGCRKSSKVVLLTNHGLPDQCVGFRLDPITKELPESFINELKPLAIEYFKQYYALSMGDGSLVSKQNLATRTLRGAKMVANNKFGKVIKTARYGAKDSSNEIKQLERDMAKTQEKDFDGEYIAASTFFEMYGDEINDIAASLKDANIKAFFKNAGVQVFDIDGNSGKLPTLSGESLLVITEVSMRGRKSAGYGLFDVNVEGKEWGDVISLDLEDFEPIRGSAYNGMKGERDLKSQELMLNIIFANYNKSEPDGSKFYHSISA